ncbi:hypothetical protein Tco_0582673 [Tanacetum coccineum]
MDTDRNTTQNKGKVDVNSKLDSATYSPTLVYVQTDFVSGVKLVCDLFLRASEEDGIEQIIAINLDTSSDNNSSDSNNNTSDSSSTSQISTSEEIGYDSPEYKGPPKSLLKWYGYLSDEYKDKNRFWGSKLGGNDSDAKPSFSDISKAKACILAKAQASEASSKAKVQACGSKAKLQTSRSKAKLQTSPKTLIVKSSVPIRNCILGLENATTWDAILSKTFGLKIPPAMACVDEKKGKRKISRGS